jgi:hypothetical protein
MIYGILTAYLRSKFRENEILLDHAAPVARAPRARRRTTPRATQANGIGLPPG